MDAALESSVAWDRLAEFVDGFGPRLSGTESLEASLDWILAGMADDGLENVRAEPVMVPRWIRGKESLELVSPRPKSMAILGLGGSIGTPAGGDSGGGPGGGELLGAGGEGRRGPGEDRPLRRALHQLR